MSAPRLNLLAKPVLTGLVYRALAADTPGADAALTRHYLEQLQARHTELLQALSSHRANLVIQAERTQSTAHDARQAQLDLQLFEKQYPMEQKRRGIFGPRLTPEQRSIQARRAELAGFAATAGADATRHREHTKSMQEHLENLEHELQSVIRERGSRLGTFQDELAAAVLSQVAEGHFEEARLALAEARSAVRGDLMVAVLIVVSELLGGGTEGALVALGELKPLFRQHPDPLPRVLGTLIGLSHGGATTRRDVGGFTPDSFSSPAFNRLYQLVRVLGGWSYDEDSLAGDPFAATLWALRELVFLDHPVEGWEPPPVGFLVDWAAESEPVCRTLALNLLLRRGERDVLPRAAGIDFAAIPAPRGRHGTWPALADLLEVPPAWPAALAGTWTAACGCHVLLGARDTAPQALYEKWLAESYNWPKDDLYWWTLAEVRGDRELLRNLRRDAHQLAVVPL